MSQILAPAKLSTLRRPSGAMVLPGAEDWADADRPRLTLGNPATGEARALLPLAGSSDVHAAVARARDFVARREDFDRALVLSRLIEAIARRREDMARAISADIGSPIDFARSRQVDAALDHLRATLKARQAHADRLEIAPGGHAVVYEPVGVAALITPWNWPLNQVALKLGGALAAGCGMVLKPSELASGAALILAECLEEAGLPDGMFTLVAGDGLAGERLVAHPGIDIVSFTGSTDVGRAIARTAGGNLVPALLELGGKSANLVFEDCDLGLAIRQGLAHCFRNSGQSCNAASRMLVAAPVYEQAVALAAGGAAGFACGAPEAAGDHLGPLVSKDQWDRVQEHIERALDEGARLVAGGLGRPEGFERGWYVRPTVLADVTPDMDIFHDEVFGPVLTLTPFADEAEAVALANATDYGLAGYLQTADAARQARVAAALNVGMVQINGHSRAEGAPFGGVGKSGYGREAGIWGIRAFQRIKSVSGLD